MFENNLRRRLDSDSVARVLISLNTFKLNLVELRGIERESIACIISNLQDHESVIVCRANINSTLTFEFHFVMKHSSALFFQNRSAFTYNYDIQLFFERIHSYLALISVQKADIENAQ